MGDGRKPPLIEGSLYMILVFLSIAQSFFGPSSMTYTKILVPQEKRKRFNSIGGITSSGAFIIGPAIGGALILITSVQITLWLNAIFFIIAAALLLLLPNQEEIDQAAIPKLTAAQIRSDLSLC